MRLRGRRDDVGDLEADAGQRDDADDDADGRGGGADGQRVLGAGLEGLDRSRRADARLARARERDGSAITSARNTHVDAERA